MSTLTITFDRVWPGHPITLSAGQTITAEAPSGCHLRSRIGVDWQDVASPFTATDTSVIRLDCDTYEGTPKIATLTITGGGA